MRSSPALLLAAVALALLPSADFAQPAAARPLAKLPGPAGTAVAFSRDGKLLLTAGAAGARVWEPETSNPLTPLLNGTPNDPSLAILSPDGKHVLTAAGPTVNLWDSASGGRIADVGRGDTRMASAYFTPDGSGLVTAGSDGVVRVHDAVTGNVLRSFKHSDSVYFAVASPDSSKLLTLVMGDVGDGALFGAAYVWDLRDGKRVARKAIDDWLYERPNGHPPPSPPTAQWPQRSAGTRPHSGTSKPARLSQRCTPRGTATRARSIAWL